MGEDIAKSLKAVAKLDANGDCWGCEMVRSATERMNGQAAQAHKESGKLGGRPAKQIPPPKSKEDVIDFASESGLDIDDAVECYEASYVERNGFTLDGKKILNWKAYTTKWCKTRKENRNNE